AASLLLGKVDLDALSLQQLHGRQANPRVELVYVARNEQANFNHDISLASEPDAAASPAFSEAPCPVRRRPASTPADRPERRARCCGRKQSGGSSPLGPPVQWPLPPPRCSERRSFFPSLRRSCWWRRPEPGRCRPVARGLAGGCQTARSRTYRFPSGPPRAKRAKPSQ